MELRDFAVNGVRDKKCNIEKIGKIPGISRISGTRHKKICILSFHNDKNENPSSQLPPRLIIKTSFVHFLLCTFASHNNQRVARAVRCTYTCLAILFVHIASVHLCLFRLHSISSISSNTATTPIRPKKPQTSIQLNKCSSPPRPRLSLAPLST